MFIVTPSVRCLMNQSIFCVFFHDIFLLTDAVLLLPFSLFYPIVIENIHFVGKKINPEVFLSDINHMEYLWLQIISSPLVLNITDRY